MFTKVSSANNDVIQMHGHSSPHTMSVIKRTKIAGAFLIPKDMTRKCQWPDYVEKAILCRLPLSTGICQYPLYKSRVVKRQDPCKESRNSHTESRGKNSVIVASFRARKSAQNIMNHQV